MSETMLDAMRRAASAPESRGIRFYYAYGKSARLTYCELDCWGRHEASRLQAAGHHPGARALLLFEPGLDFVRALYAALYAGLVVVPVPVVPMRDLSAAGRHMERIAADSGSKLWITSSGGAGALGDTANIWTLSDVGETTLSKAWTPPAIRPDDPVILQYTSGSTADPKGVTITQSNLSANQRAIAAAMEVDDNDIVAGWLPHYHDMGLIGMYLQSVFCGAELIATGPAQFLRRPAFWLRLISDHRATGTVAPDFAYQLCAKLVSDNQLAQLDLSSLRTAITGAEPIRVATLERFAKRFAAAGFNPKAFAPAYGMAETTLLVTAKAQGDSPRTLKLDGSSLEAGVAVPTSGSSRVTEVVSCGRPAPAHQVEIVDAVTGKVLPDGTVGELWVAGPSVSTGYWRRPEASKATFGAKIDGDEADFLRTGDLGFRMDNELFITGRLKDVIVVHGRNIYATDVEKAVSDAISEDRGPVVAVFEGADGSVVAAVETSSGISMATLEDVRQTVALEFGLERLRFAAVPSKWVPRTTSGKIRRTEARRLLTEATDTTFRFLPSTDGAART